MKNASCAFPPSSNHRQIICLGKMLLCMFLFGIGFADARPSSGGISRDSGSTRSVQLHHRQINNTIVPIRRDCPFSPWDELYITDFLQEHFNDLSTTDHCWIIKGVAGLHELLQRNISANPLLNVTIPTCIQLNVTSKGNAFSIDFSDDSYKVNGVDEDDFVLLTYVHRGLPYPSKSIVLYVSNRL